MTTSTPVRPDEPVTIGKPVANNQVYVLNEHQQLQPIGVPGELCVSGEVWPGKIELAGADGGEVCAQPLRAGAKDVPDRILCGGCWTGAWSFWGGWMNR